MLLRFLFMCIGAFPLTGYVCWLLISNDASPMAILVAIAYSLITITYWLVFHLEYSNLDWTVGWAIFAGALAFIGTPVVLMVDILRLLVGLLSIRLD